MAENNQENDMNEELPKQVVESLGRLFPSVEPGDAHVQSVAAQLASPEVEVTRTAPAASSAGTWNAPKVWWAIAASVCLAAFMCWQFFGDSSHPQDGNAHLGQRSLVTLYDQVGEGRLEPEIAFNESAETFANAFGVSVKKVGGANNISLTGISNLGGLSPQTVTMIGSADGDAIVVFIDRAEKDVAQMPRVIRTYPDGIKLKAFRIVRDGLVFYEFSKFKQAKLVPSLLIAPAG